MLCTVAHFTLLRISTEGVRFSPTLSSMLIAAVFVVLCIDSRANVSTFFQELKRKDATLARQFDIDPLKALLGGKRWRDLD